MKNMISNPGFEAAEKSTVMLAAAGSTTSLFKQVLFNIKGNNQSHCSIRRSGQCLQLNRMDIGIVLPIPL